MVTGFYPLKARLIQIYTAEALILKKKGGGRKDPPQKQMDNFRSFIMGRKILRIVRTENVNRRRKKATHPSKPSFL